MIYFNIKRLLELRGIDKPHAFFVKNGFSNQMAANLVHNNVGYVRPAQMEKLCLLFNCTPNDLFDWRPDKNASVAEDHPLRSLVKEKNPLSLSDMVKDLPVKKLHRLETLINELKNEE